MSYMEGLHPLLREKKQHVQGRVTRSEFDLISQMRSLDKSNDFISTVMMHSMASLMIVGKPIGL